MLLENIVINIVVLTKNSIDKKTSVLTKNIPIFKIAVYCSILA